MVAVMRSRFHKGASIVLCLSLLQVSACATTDASMSPEEQKLHDSNQRYYETVATGAVALGLVGAGIGALAGGARGAAIGAGAGVAAGAAAGWAVASMNQNYADKEDDLQKQIDHAVALQTKYAEDVELSEKIVKANTQKIALLRTEVRNKTASIDQYNAEIARQQKVVAELNNSLEQNGKLIAELKDDNSKRIAQGVKSPEYAKTIQKYETLYARQQQALDTLVASQQEPAPAS